MTDRTTDEALVGAFGRGDQSAFDAIVARYSADVAALANRLLGWPGEVDDVTQEVFLAAYLHLSRFRGQCSLRSWLFTITINKCRSHIRRQWVRRRFLTRFVQRVDPLPSSRENDGALQETLSRALQSLPARYREPIVLHYLEGLSVEQIGQVLTLSSNAVHVRLNRARQRLKEHLAPWSPRHE